jgi:hypothetical protein
MPKKKIQKHISVKLKKEAPRKVQELWTTQAFHHVICSFRDSSRRITRFCSSLILPFHLSVFAHFPLDWFESGGKRVDIVFYEHVVRPGSMDRRARWLPRLIFFRGRYHERGKIQPHWQRWCVFTWRAWSQANCPIVALRQGLSQLIRCHPLPNTRRTTEPGKSCFCALTLRGLCFGFGVGLCFLPKVINWRHALRRSLRQDPFKIQSVHEGFIIGSGWTMAHVVRPRSDQDSVQRTLSRPQVG